MMMASVHTSAVTVVLTVSCSAKSIPSMMFSLEHCRSTDEFTFVVVPQIVSGPSIHRLSEGSGVTTVLIGRQFNSFGK